MEILNKLGMTIIGQPVLLQSGALMIIWLLEFGLPGADCLLVFGYRGSEIECKRFMLPPVGIPPPGAPWPPPRVIPPEWIGVIIITGIILRFLP